MSQRIPNGSSSDVLRSYQCRRGTISLRYQLAEDGCAESQLALARSLFSDCANKEERETNARIAIQWLLRASEKGNSDAFRLLKECCDTGCGINCNNFFSVVKCLQLSETEIIARRVGHNLFSSIMSDSEEVISEELFQEKVDVILSSEQNPDMNTSDKSDNSFESPHQKIINENIESPTILCEPSISIKDVVSSVQQCLEGSLPIVTLRRVVQHEEYNKWFSLKYVHKLSNLLCSSLMLFIKAFGSSEYSLALVLYSIIVCLLGHKLIFEMNITTVFLCSLIALILMQTCSCYIASFNIELFSVNRWLDLIKLFEPVVDEELVKQKFLHKTLSPLVIFLVASSMFNLLYPLDLLKIITPELFIFSVLMLLLLDRSIKFGRRYVNLSLLLNILVCLNKGNFLTNEGLGYFNYLNFQMHLPIYKEYEIHLTCLSCLTLPFVLPYLYCRMAFGCEKYGWQLILLPHLMCLTWLNFVFNLYQTCETNEILWGSCFWFAVLFFTHFIGALPSLVLMLFAKSIYTAGIWSNISIFVLLSIICFFACMFVVRKLSLLFGNYLLAFLLIVIFGLTISLKSYSVGLTSASDPILSWEKYEMYCHRHAWYRSNPANVEIACLPLKGKKIYLDGIVTAINVRDVKDHANCFVAWFPSFVSQVVMFVFGDDFCKKQDISVFDKDRCALYSTMNANAYQLQNWNSYTYSITLEISSRASPEVILKVDHSCSSFIKTLKEGDSLHTIGILDAAIGSSLPEVILENATCTSCYENINCLTIQEPKAQFDFTLSVRHLVKFYLFPFVQANK